jgi:hypothetical protein
MAFRIEKTEDLIEVHLWGYGDEAEVVNILRKLRGMAPRKEISDLWLISEEYVVPLDAFLRIVKELIGFLSNDMIAKKSAIVVANHSKWHRQACILKKPNVCHSRSVYS